MNNPSMRVAAEWPFKPAYHESEGVFDQDGDV